MADEKKTETCIVSGVISISDPKLKDAVYDVEIRLFKGGRLYSMTIPDAKGNFRHALKKNSGEYDFEFAHDNFESLWCKVTVGNENIDVGKLVFG